MKNIYLIQTDKPSKLHLGNSGLVLCDLNFGKNTINGQHIYITSDEEIKESDYYLSWEDYYNPPRYVVYVKSSGVNGDGKKIILTTDQDLIADGVQAIDDKFLEWFVKNPSCVYVQVTPSEFLADKVIYEIIIPQQMTECYFTPNTTTSSATICVYCGKEKFLHTIGKGIEFSKSVTITEEESKQETLEEAKQKVLSDAAENYYKQFDNLPIVRFNAFIAGAKWQAERMYSEDKVIILLNKFGGKVYGDYTRNQTMEDFTEEWFEQFKKK